MSQSADDRVIILLQLQSQYDVLRQFNVELALALDSLGYRAEVVDLTKPNGAEKLSDLITREKIYFFIGFNGALIDLKTNDQSIFDRLNVPYLLFLVDHPIYQVNRLKTPLNRMVVAAVDKDHIPFMRNVLKLKRPMAFIPHAARVVTGDLKPIRDRTMDIMFAGTYENPDTYRQKWLSLSAPLRAILDEVVDACLYQNDVALMDAFESVATKHGLVRFESDSNILPSVLMCIDKYVRLRRREMVLSSLRESEVHVFGAGWEGLQAKSSNHVFHGNAKYHQIQECMRDSKMVLNILPFFTQGAHERLFETLMSGAVSLSDENAYLRSHFQHGSDILFYQLNEPNLSDVVAAWLSNPDALQCIADEGRKTAEHHTWRERASQIIDVIELESLIVDKSISSEGH